VYCGMYALRIDQEMKWADVAFGNDSVLQRISSPSPVKVAQALDRLAKGIESRKQDPRKFETALKKSYSVVLASKRLPFGEKVSVNEVMAQMALLKQKSEFLANPNKENYRGYGRAEFAYDLMQASSVGESAGFRLHGATQDVTGDQRKYIWVPALTKGVRPAGSPVSYISFEQG